MSPQQFVAEARVEAFAVSVFPWSPWFIASEFGADGSDPILHFPGNRPRPFADLMHTGAFVQPESPIFFCFSGAFSPSHHWMRWTIAHQAICKSNLPRRPLVVHTSSCVVQQTGEHAIYACPTSDQIPPDAAAGSLSQTLSAASAIVTPCP